MLYVYSSLFAEFGTLFGVLKALLPSMLLLVQLGTIGVVALSAEELLFAAMIWWLLAVW